ncbi:MAG TPA: DUF429 domain-containing protein [Burkholderiaceae bacterium]|nr:DUF429 domain-containing protein [Burkholderiaceae bacterium]
MRILGVDFTSRPGPRKPIVVAVARAASRIVHVESIRRIETFAAFEDRLREDGPWIGGFDFPFGLPRAFVDARLPARDWADLVERVAAMSRDEFCAITWDAFRAAKGRPDLKHREVDSRAGSHSPLKTMDPVRRHAVNPPVGLMFYEGTPRLLRAGVDIPGLHRTAADRVALEAYPGWVARGLGERWYKNDEPRHGRSRIEARGRIVAALAAGSWMRMRVRIAPEDVDAVLEDAGGDRLDAVMCVALAAFAARQPGFGVPPDVDPVEGWVAGVPR